MNTAWIVDPSSTWLDNHLQWLPEANVPDAPVCSATLTSVRCSLIAGHSTPHTMRTSPPASWPHDLEPWWKS